MQLELLDQSITTLNYHLGDPYMTLLHRAGLAGLCSAHARCPCCRERQTIFWAAPGLPLA